MSTVITGEYVTFSEAAQTWGVTVQRAHQLAKTYGVITQRVNDRLLLIPISEMTKVPSAAKRKRLSGVKMDHRRN